MAFLMTAIALANGGTGPNYCTRHPRGCYVGSVAGGVAGGVLAYRYGRDRRDVEEVVIYRAP